MFKMPKGKYDDKTKLVDGLRNYVKAVIAGIRLRLKIEELETTDAESNL